jgi:hypothetical protein
MKKGLISVLCVMLLSAFMPATQLIDCLTNFDGTGQYKKFRADHNGAMSKPFRVVKTAKGDEEITVIDNYRIAYHNAKEATTVSVKIEKSAADGYAVDQEIIRDNLLYIVQYTRNLSYQQPDSLNFNGTNVYGYTKSKVDSSSFIGSYLFFPGDDYTVYVNFHLGKENPAAYSSLDQFISQRDQFLRKYIEQLKKCGK